MWRNWIYIKSKQKKNSNEHLHIQEFKGRSLNLF